MEKGLNGKMKLIINVDDLGWSEYRDKAIFELFERGKISSGTVLMNGYNAENAIKTARKLNFPLGVHLNLTEGPPVNRTFLENNTLVALGRWKKNEVDEEEDEYVMHGKFGIRERITINQIRKEDIANEIYSQVKHKFRYFLFIIMLKILIYF
jgi:hypothetical protein